MSVINVAGAAARLLAYGTTSKAGLCLHYVWLAISQGAVHYITGGASDADATWLATPNWARHIGDRNVPKDMPAYLGTKKGSAAGDVMISTGTYNSFGQLLFAATDWPTGKRIGLCTLAQREAQTGRGYLGWAETMGGHTLTGYAFEGEIGELIPPTPDAPASPTIQEDDMSQRPLWIRKTNGKIENSVFALVYPDTLINGKPMAVQLDGRTAAGQSGVADIRNQFAHYFPGSEVSGRGVTFNEISLVAADYDSIIANSTVVTPPISPPFK